MNESRIDFEVIILIYLPLEWLNGLLPFEILASGLDGSTPRVSGTLGSDFLEYSGSRLLSLFHFVVCLCGCLFDSSLKKKEN